jgi:adenosylcobinamide-GDP ribazoletransferase
MTPRLRRQADLALLAAGFLTRLPLPAPRYTPARMAAAFRHFPAVGAVIGAAGGLVLLVAGLALPAALAVLLATAAVCALTGALHEDGLADTLDGLGGRTRDRALEIMRDSGLGTYGALGLGLVVATRVTALAAMVPALAAAALAVGHAVSRLSIVLVVATSRYVRPEGAGAFTRTGVGRRDVAFAAATGLACLAALAAAEGPLAALGATAGAGAGHLLARAVFEPRLGGYTGDCLGAVQQLTEAGFYVGLVACL